MDQDSSLGNNEESFHLFPLYIEPWGPEGQMGHASGFVVKKTVFEETAMGTSQGLTKHLQQIDNYFLITTWQVVTGINLGASTERPKALDEVRIALLCGNNERQERTCHQIPLYSENMTPNWIEHPKGGQQVDVVALPMTLPAGAILVPLNHNTSCTKPQLETKVAVLGYPLDINAVGKMKMDFSPMWMEAAITDIPEDKSDNLFHINPQAGSGMAGAPVWLCDKSENSSKHISPRCVAGVYSGNSKKETAGGIVWGIDVVWELLDNPRQGFNPTAQVPQAIEKHNFNGSTLENDEILIHFTANRNALLSILNYGLLYLHNETEIFIDLIGDYLNIDAEPESSGMVCFTDIPIDELKAIRDTENSLGSKLTGYGIAVEKNWAIANGAGRVIYLDKLGPVYECLRKLFHLSLPDNLIGRPTIDHQLENKDDTILPLSTIDFIRDVGLSPVFSELIELHNWMQTARDIAQREWRIRNPYSYTGIQKLPRDKQVEKLLSLIQDPNIQHMGGEALSLILDPTKIHYLICPSNEVEAMRLSLEATPFHGVEIKSI